MFDRQSRLSPPMTREILAYLGMTVAGPPNLDLLDALVGAYTRRVPWESFSRIAKKAGVRQRTGQIDIQACARWPAEFWQSALDWGTGGTCFESNYAFFALLRNIGFSCYLTVNNMEPTVGCHAAIVVTFGGRKWLADVGLPLYVPLPIDPHRPSRRDSPFHRYTVQPSEPNVYRIERDQHPQPYCFTLIDEAVSAASFRQVLAGDYGSDGLFLDRVIINKVVDGYICRFNGGEQPFRLERFRPDYRSSRQLGSELAGDLARFFALDEALLREALHATGVRSGESGAGADGPQRHAEKK